MGKIYKYRKVTDQYTTYNIVEPDYSEGDLKIIDLATIDGVSYVFMPDGVILPNQPKQVVLEECIVDEALYNMIERSSSHTELINRRINDGILTMTEGEATKRLLGYIPTDFKTKIERMAEIETSIKSSILYKMDGQEIEKYIIDKVTDLPSVNQFLQFLAKEIKNILHKLETGS